MYAEKKEQEERRAPRRARRSRSPRRPNARARVRARARVGPPRLALYIISLCSPRRPNARARARARARVGPPRLAPKQIRQIGAAFRLSFIASCPGNYSCNYLFQIAAAHFRCHTLLATSRTEILLPITPNHCSHSALTSSPHFKIGPRGKERAWARAPLL